VTGLGRQGRWLTYLRGDAKPDIVILGKPLGGGVAATAAIVVSREVAGALDGHSWQNYSTFRGHPIVVAAIAETLRTIEGDGLVERADSLDERFRAGLGELADRHPVVTRFDGLGLHWTVELVGGDWRDWYADTAEPAIAARVTKRALERGALIATSGEETSLFLAPALNSPEEDLDQILTALDEGLELGDQLIDRRGS
jgi:4-aminobutyrate aminotransferase-like enzyme